jgi:hypothetical protein
MLVINRIDVCIYNIPYATCESAQTRRSRVVDHLFHRRERLSVFEFVRHMNRTAYNSKRGFVDTALHWLWIIIGSDIGRTSDEVTLQTGTVTD